MAKLDNQGVLHEALQQLGQVGNGLARAMKREGELHEHSAQFCLAHQNVESHANFPFFRAPRGKIVREALPQFGGEHEPWVGSDFLDPLFGLFDAQRAVERGVDFDGVEELRKI